MPESDVPITTLNAFSRKYDLIFVEMERKGEGHVYKFIDFNNEESRYTADEIREKVALG